MRYQQAPWQQRHASTPPCRHSNDQQRPRQQRSIARWGAHGRCEPSCEAFAASSAAPERARRRRPSQRHTPPSLRAWRALARFARLHDCALASVQDCLRYSASSSTSCARPACRSARARRLGPLGCRSAAAPLRCCDTAKSLGREAVAGSSGEGQRVAGGCANLCWLRKHRGVAAARRTGRQRPAIINERAGLLGVVPAIDGWGGRKSRNRGPRSVLVPFFPSLSAFGRPRPARRYLTQPSRLLDLFFLRERPARRCPPPNLSFLPPHPVRVRPCRPPSPPGRWELRRCMSCCC